MDKEPGSNKKRLVHAHQQERDQQRKSDLKELLEEQFPLV